MSTAQETEPWSYALPRKKPTRKEASSSFEGLGEARWWAGGEEDLAGVAAKLFITVNAIQLSSSPGLFRSLNYLAPSNLGRLFHFTLPANVAGGSASALPAELAYINEAIERSRPMLEWEDDWDGEGSPSYAGATWESAVDFIIRNAVRLYEQLGTRIPAPVIRPGPGGSIDIDWQSGQRELLINIPVDQAEPATFYGRDTSGTTIEGTLDTSGRNQWMLMWLAA